MTGRTCALVVINCTPNQLRELATRLDYEFARAKLGDDVPTETMHLGGVEVRFVIDQMEMHDERRRAELKSVPS